MQQQVMSTPAAIRMKPPSTAAKKFNQSVQHAKKLIVEAKFNGDTDPCVSYEGTRQAIKEVGFNETVGGAYRPWFFNATATTEAILAEKPLLYGPDLSLVEAGAQFAGHVVTYEHNLHFVTVHGSGHMVPQFRPRVAFKLMSNLINNEEFAKPLLDDLHLLLICMVNLLFFFLFFSFLKKVQLYYKS